MDITIRKPHAGLIFEKIAQIPPSYVCLGGIRYTLDTLGRVIDLRYQDCSGAVYKYDSEGRLIYYEEITRRQTQPHSVWIYRYSGPTEQPLRLIYTAYRIVNSILVPAAEAQIEERIEHLANTPNPTEEDTILRLALQAVVDGEMVTAGFGPPRIYVNDHEITQEVDEMRAGKCI